MYPFYHTLSQAQMQEFENALKQKNYPKGAMIHCHAQSCLGMFLVKKGSVSLSAISDDGKKITFFRIREGEICVLGAACVLKKMTFEAHFEAAEDSSLEILGASALSSLMNANPQFENLVYKMAAERLSEIIAAVQSFLFCSIEKRIARFLWQESIDKSSLFLPITHEEIAHYTGSAREVITRELNKMSKKNIISLRRKAVEILDTHALKELI